MTVTPQVNLRTKLSQVFGKIPVVLSPNRSSRYGKAVRMAVIHTTESSDSSFAGIINYFKSTGAQASAHYVVDALPGKGEVWTKVTQMVPEAEKAWTQRSANPVCVSYELIGRASRTRKDWLTTYRTQLETAAALVAEDVLQYKIPLKHPADPGIVGHGDLNKLGYPNTHTDPGAGFPWDVFMDAVKRYVDLGSQVPKPEPVPIPRAGRPASAPKFIPLWAWQLMVWHDGGKQGPRPLAAPAYVPKWYWEWRAWRLGLRVNH